MSERHRAPRWWARHRITTATAAGALVVTLVVGFGAAVGPRPQVDQPQPIAAQPDRGRASGTKPWPTVTIPSIGAPGAWDPDATTTPSTEPDAPESPRCSRCGERTPAPATPAPVEPTPPDPRPPDSGDQDADGPTDPAPSSVAELLALVNGDRATNGCGPVTLDPSLVGQSQAHAEQQAADDVMYHSGGVTGFDTWGENVAYGYDTAAAVHDAWMNSAGHRANILNCAFTVMGAGAADGATGVRYWTEQFAA